MFNVGWAEFLVLVVAGLFVFGPERLPEAAAWLGRTVRQVREYATGAREHLRSELGPEFDELRKPLEDLRGLRGFDPRRTMTRHLFDDFEEPPVKPNGYAPGPNLTKPTGSTAGPPPPAVPAPTPLTKNERPPIDPDAT